MAKKKQPEYISAKELEKQERKRIRKQWHWGTFRHVLMMIATFLVAVIALVVMVLGQFFKGPSPAASDMLTQLLHQSSALKFVPYLYLYEHVPEALARGEVPSIDEATDTSLITVKAREAKTYATGEEEEQFDENGIRIVDVTGPTYHGYMMIVQDPSRVSVGTCMGPGAGSFNPNRAGKRVDEIMKLYDAIAIMNGGAFADANGGGDGGTPEGLVISDGKLMKRASSHYPVVAGFDKDDILHVGNFSQADAEKLGLRDACAFGPALIVNGKANVSNDKGLNPRSAIGQRADGAVLLLVIDGRQANSLGATYADVISVLQDFGAVNACNMDGGSSTTMYYGENKVNDGMTVSVSRRMATCWIVK